MPPRIGPKKPVRVFLAQHREAARLTQEQIGQRIHPPVDKGTVSRWETAAPGRLSLGVIAAYAETLGKRADEMYRPPQDGPSLDALAAGLAPEDREVAADLISRLARQRAS
jgi:transcriptional regulator with XRE-family HTH domain